MNLPPEVVGCLSVAQKHLTTSRKTEIFRRYYKGKDRQARHMMKVQKLVAKAVKYLHARGEVFP